MKAEDNFANFFSEDVAASYDARFKSAAPMRNALNLVLAAALSDLPNDARILCVGAGTGSELIYLAQRFPRWRFTALDPSSPMLNICRRRTEELGLSSRCNFHEGYLDTLPDTAPFDGATSILVSQFCMRPEDRRAFVRQIADRTHPGAYLINADLTSDMTSETYQSLLNIWMRMFEMSAEQQDSLRATYGRDVAVSPRNEVESLIASSGFEYPVLFFQTLLIHAWYTRRSA